MPNTPLQTFRSVEPANWGFGAAATISSQPFVLTHCIAAGVNGTGSPLTNQACTFSSSILSANRFIPWVSRDFDNPGTTGAYFPVKVPQAYDRIYIFPMFMASTNDVQGVADTMTLSMNAYQGPWAIPMGMMQETRGYSTTNKNHPLVMYFPDDLIFRANPNHLINSNYSTRGQGIWAPLPPYASNFSTSNGLLAVGSATNPVSYGRNTNTSTGVGTAYAFPDDFTISKAGTAAVSETASDHAGGSIAVMGAGQEYQTLGCEEIVLCLGTAPSGLNLSATTSTLSRTYFGHWFMMGVFLG